MDAVREGVGTRVKVGRRSEEIKELVTSEFRVDRSKSDRGYCELHKPLICNSRRASFLRKGERGSWHSWAAEAKSRIVDFLRDRVHLRNSFFLTSSSPLPSPESSRHHTINAKRVRSLMSQ